MNQCTTQNKEREFRVNGSNAKIKMCFEVRAPSSTSPPSPRRISNPLGVPNSSLNQYNLHRGNTNGLPKTGVPNSTKQPIQPQPRQYKLHNPPLPKRDTNTNSNSNFTSQRGSKPQPQPLPKREQPTTQIHLYQRGISTKQGFTTWWYL